VINKQITDPLVSAQAFTYHYKSNASLVDEITIPSGAKQSKQYDVMGRLTQIAARKASKIRDRLIVM